MRRCLQLAKLATGSAAPNPVVGAVLVHEGRIIGEGYHKRFGGSHAEVECVRSVSPENVALIQSSTMYVSLEPCAHWGKTPPCADLIVRHKIPSVVVGCRDPFAEVNGKGIEQLRAAGVDVTVGVLEKECREANRRFFTFHQHNRPYVVLKWAQTADGKVSGPPAQNAPLLRRDVIPPMREAGDEVPRLRISNGYTNRLVHKWRSEEAAILVGTNTAWHDNPQLTTRLWPGANPVRIVVDKELRLPAQLKLFDGRVPTLVFNHRRHTLPFENLLPQNLSGVQYYQMGDDANLVHQILSGLYTLNIQSVMVEGGATLLQSFIEEAVWDEARVITAEAMVAGSGLPAPVLKGHRLVDTKKFETDAVRFYQPVTHP